MIDFHYTQTTEEVVVGDDVLLDGTCGVVLGVFRPGTQDAADFSCERTGGLLIDLSGSGKTLIPIGTNSTLFKAVRPSNMIHKADSD